MSELRIFEFPLTLIGALALVAGVFLASSSIRRGKQFPDIGANGRMPGRWSSKSVISRIGLPAHCSSQCAAVLLLLGAILMAIEGTWGIGMFHTLPFWVFVLVLMFCCGLAVFPYAGKAIERIIGKHSNGRTSLSFAFISLHAGFFLLLCGGFFGAPDFSRLQLKADKDMATNIAYDSNGVPRLLPFHITLEEFRTDYYNHVGPSESNANFDTSPDLSARNPNGEVQVDLDDYCREPESLDMAQCKPKQFTSRLTIDGNIFETSVNHPCLYKGYRIYQADYDKLNGGYSILILVKDPWLPVVFLGMALMAAGAVLELRKLWKGRALLISAVVLAIAFAAISLARIQFATLMPALRSLWFVPHLVFYMLSYSLLAITLVLAFCHIVQAAGSSQAYFLIIICMKTSMLLMLLGMLCGAVWAKYAWGDYWTWDAKECWAAATWLLTLAAIHICHTRIQFDNTSAVRFMQNASGKQFSNGNISGEPAFCKESCVEFISDKTNGARRTEILLLILIIAAFAAMQITWYGVNSLPSANNSLHTYNKSK